MGLSAEQKAAAAALRAKREEKARKRAAGDADGEPSNTPSQGAPPHPDALVNNIFTMPPELRADMAPDDPLDGLSVMSRAQAKFEEEGPDYKGFYRSVDTSQRFWDLISANHGPNQSLFRIPRGSYLQMGIPLFNVLEDRRLPAPTALLVTAKEVGIAHLGDTAQEQTPELNLFIPAWNRRMDRMELTELSGQSCDLTLCAAVEDPEASTAVTTVTKHVKPSNVAISLRCSSWKSQELSSLILDSPASGNSTITLMIRPGECPNPPFEWGEARKGSPNRYRFVFDRSSDTPANASDHWPTAIARRVGETAATMIGAGHVVEIVGSENVKGPYHAYSTFAHEFRTEYEDRWAVNQRRGKKRKTRSSGKGKEGGRSGGPSDAAYPVFIPFQEWKDFESTRIIRNYQRKLAELEAGTTQSRDLGEHALQLGFTSDLTPGSD